MGYQLWTSPITGYRRKGTRLAELRSLIGSGITAHAVLEPLQSCPVDASASKMAKILRQRDFDVAGVQSQQDGAVIGFVTRQSLTNGMVRDHMRPMTADQLISDATPLPSLLSVLKTRQHTFVLIGPGVRGITTRTDLNKPPVRMYLFGLMSLLEMHLGFWIRAVYGEDSWQKKLTDKRLDAATRLQADRRKRNQNVSLVECLQFCDRRDLVTARQDLRDRLCLGSKAYALVLLKRAEDLRNLLAHSQQDLVKGSSWEEVIALVEWVETVIHRSDEEVEQQAKNLGGRVQEGLWASV
jgi:hypothetical protein